MATSTVENYLKAILQLEEHPEREASVGAIAEALEVTPGTVTSMMKHLAERGLIEYVPRHHVALLPKGRAEALLIVRRHRLIETFLVRVMKLDWAQVHEEAEVLEHVISDRLLARMDEMLGYPSSDPHGDPIPDHQGVVQGAAKTTHPLSTASCGNYRLVRVDDSDSPLLHWLDRHSLHPGSEFSVTASDQVSGVLEIALRDHPAKIQLGVAAAEKILVEPDK